MIRIASFGSVYPTMNVSMLSYTAAICAIRRVRSRADQKRKRSGGFIVLQVNVIFQRVAERSDNCDSLVREAIEIAHRHKCILTVSDRVPSLQKEYVNKRGLVDERFSRHAADQTDICIHVEVQICPGVYEILIHPGKAAVAGPQDFVYQSATFCDTRP